MANQESREITMLTELIDYAIGGKNVQLNAKPSRDIVTLKAEGKDIATIVISMEYSGMVNDKPFVFKKEYSHAYDETEHAFDSLLIANNRLQIDYDRLKDGGIEVKREFFTFQNTFLGLPGLASAKRPALRLETFINLARAGIPVSVEVILKRPDILAKAEDIDKRGFAYMADFVFTTEEGETTIEKLYDQGLQDDTEERKTRIREVANKRLERDFERLRHVGMKVKTRAFQEIGD